MDPTPPLRDNYGLEVNRDYADLLQTYTPLWISDAVRNTAKWRTYLQTAAEQLGILEAAATADLNLHDASCSKLIASVLREVLLLGERHAPDLFESLVELVADGVPNDLRPHVWPALLGARKHCPAGHYSRLVALHQQLSSTLIDSSSSNAGAAAPTPAAAAGDGVPAAAGLQDSAQATSSTAAAAAAAAEALGVSGESLLLWRCHAKTWRLQIDKDCHRTFPGHDWLSGPEGQAALRRLLSCFCLAAPQLGYCQGMNFVAGALLLVLTGGGRQQQQQQQCASSSSAAAHTQADAVEPARPPRASASSSRSSSGGADDSAAAGAAAGLEGPESLAFGCLLAFAEHVLPGYYSPAMVAPQVDQRVLGHLLRERLRHLTNHLSSLGVEPTQPLPGWLLAGWASSGMPFETVARLWDAAFLERSPVPLIRACLGLYHLFGVALLSSQDVIDASLLLQAMPARAFDGDTLLLVAGAAYGDLDADALQALQHCFRAEVVAELEAAAAATAARRQQQQQQQQQKTAAEQLGILEAAATADLNLHDASCSKLIASVLREVLLLGERHAPDLFESLVELVADGVPNDLRPHVWPALLGARKHCPAGHYSRLVALHQQLSSTLTDSSSSNAGAAASTPAAAAGDGVPAAAGLQDSAQATSSTAAAAAAAAAEALGVSGESLLLWRCHAKTWRLQIDKDCHRTFPGHDWLSGPEGQAALRRLLSCFCLAAPQLGYCQGMNFVAGALLLVLTGGGRQQQQQQQCASSSSAAAHTQADAVEPARPPRASASSSRSSSGGADDSAAAAAAAAAAGLEGPESLAFGCLLAIAEHVLPGYYSPAMVAPQVCERVRCKDGATGNLVCEGVRFEVLGVMLAIAEHVLPGYYSPAMVAPQVDQRVLGHLLREHLPHLTDHLSSLGVEPTQPLPGWLLAGWASSGMPFETVARLWDAAFLERSPAPLIRACLGLYHLFGGALLSSQDVIDASLLLQAMPALAFDGDTLLLVAGAAYGDLDADALQQRQQQDMADLCEQYGLQAVQDAYVAAARAAAAAAADQPPQQQQQQQQQQCCQAAAQLLKRYEGVIDMSLTCAEGLLAALAAKEGAAAALEQQLARSMARLAAQDAEAASKDELIEQLQAQLRAAAAASGGGSSSSPQRQAAGFSRLGSFGKQASPAAAAAAAGSYSSSAGGTSGASAAANAAAAAATSGQRGAAADSGGEDVE
ncbi:hypothetical protein OEZ85_013718 [Tetradesmus obliquus]|uniref:Rab-GAP TBC domain-containing protein n=1 Tax=Tetradesmus obliquus TaxID=3088 RepID=A0ABY8UUY9_TETOB|nr:hypothetical protein OEZ85_013718 [Tetradesmus obliquus]